jgi:hypothetical protein
MQIGPPQQNLPRGDIRTDLAEDVGLPPLGDAADEGMAPHAAQLDVFGRLEHLEAPQVGPSVGERVLERRVQQSVKHPDGQPGILATERRKAVPAGHAPFRRAESFRIGIAAVSGSVLERRWISGVRDIRHRTNRG